MLPLRLGLALLAFGLPAAGLATSYSRDLSLRDRADRSTRVVIAQVVERRVTSEGGAPPRLGRVTRLWVREDLKGQGPGALEIHQLGGESGPWSSGVVGDASFEPGESVIAFLRCDSASQGLCTLVGLGLGKLPLRSRAGGGVEALVPYATRPRPDIRTLEAVVDEIRGMGPSLVPGTPSAGADVRGASGGFRPTVTLPTGQREGTR